MNLKGDDNMSLSFGIMGTGGIGGILVISGSSRNASKKVRTYNNLRPKKKLHYNSKEVSSAILRSKTSISASKAVVKARGRLVMLRRKLYSGEYDENELRHAIIHAESMVRVAKKRLKHMKQEENEKRALDDEFSEYFDLDKEKNSDLEAVSSENQNASENYQSSQPSDEELMYELEKLMQEALEAMEEMDEADFEDFCDEYVGITKDIEPEDLALKKKKHRAEEMRDIVKADMKYLKAMFNKWECEKNNISNGISLEIGGIEIPYSPPMPVVSEGGNVDVSV